MKKLIYSILKKSYRVYSFEHSFIKLIYLFFYQKVLQFNFHVPWPVHYTTYISGVENIQMGKGVALGVSPFQYIQARAGIILKNNIRVGPGVHFISTNHAFDDYEEVIPSKPIIVGSDVWIGSHSVILPGVEIGDNVIIGAGSIVNKNIPSDCIAAGNPCKKIKNKAPYKGNVGN